MLHRNVRHMDTSYGTALHSMAVKFSPCIKMMPKLRTYIKFKKVFEFEPYVLSFMSIQRRSYLAELRNGILPLQIEVG